MNGFQTTIYINKLRIRAFHGVFEQERTVGNIFEVSVALTAGCREAMLNDNLDGTVNYAEVVKLIKDEMRKPSKLLENVAYRIYKAVCSRYPSVTSGEITVSKPAPPVSAQLDSVGFCLKW